MESGMRKGWLITGLVTLVIVGAGVGGAIYYGSDDTLPKGFNVGGLTVGGQPADAALEQVQGRFAELETIEITVTPPNINGSTDKQLSDPTRTLKQLGMRADAAEAVKAIEQFRDASLWDRAIIRYQNKLKSTYGINVTWDEEMFRKEVTSSWSSAAGNPPKEATRTINERDEVVYTSEVIGTELDTQALFAAVKSFEPKSLSDKTGTSGASNTIELPVSKTEPKVTVAMLKEEGIERKIVEFTTSFTSSGEGRTYNVTVAAKALNETLLMPDEIFDYGKSVAKAEKEYGYKVAPVFL
jgi:vancomycin resistance protein YoaR